MLNFWKNLVGKGQKQVDEISHNVDQLIESDGAGGFRPRPGISTEQIRAATEKINGVASIYNEIADKQESLGVDAKTLGKDLGRQLDRMRNNPRHWNSPSPFMRAVIGK